jgi:drug/metabolite transporter (DMT)-like permease
MARGRVIGTAAAAAGAFSYGVTVIVNRELATRGFGPDATLGIRFSVAAGVLLGLLAIRRRPLLPVPGERVRALLLGLVGYAIESSLFYRGIQRGSAAAVALLFYSYPALVTVIELVSGRQTPRVRLLAPLALSLAGTALIVAAGSEVTISRAGVLFTLAAAAAFSVYLLASARIVQRTDALTNGAWVAAGAAISLLLQGAATGGLRAPGSSWWLLGLNGLATAAAFSLMFAALKRLGPSLTAVVMTLEALSAVILGALILHERLTTLQLVGGAAILAATVLIATAKAAPAMARPEEP